MEMLNRREVSLSRVSRAHAVCLLASTKDDGVEIEIRLSLRDDTEPPIVRHTPGSPDDSTSMSAVCRAPLKAAKFVIPSRRARHFSSLIDSDWKRVMRITQTLEFVDIYRINNGNITPDKYRSIASP